MATENQNDFDRAGPICTGLRLFMPEAAISGFTIVGQEGKGVFVRIRGVRFSVSEARGFLETAIAAAESDLEIRKKILCEGKVALDRSKE